MELIIQDFIDYLNNKQVSKNTLASYERDIVQLLKYLNKIDKKMFEATKEDIESYIAYLMSLGKSTATISRSVASIKAFYKYLFKTKLVEKNVAESLSSPRVEKKDVSILSEDEMQVLLSQPNENELKGQRDKTMLEVLWDSGIKVTELVSLNVSSVSFSPASLKIDKGGKERIVPLSQRTVEYLKYYMEEIRPLIIRSDDEEILFVNTNGRKLTRQGFWKILKEYKVEANIKKELTPHTIRHSYAVHMLHNGVDVHDLQELLGHTDVASTMMYLRLPEFKDEKSQSIAQL